MSEAIRIVSLIKNYLPEEKLTELLIKLDEEIGKKSTDELTKKFLAQLRNVVDKPLPPPPFWLWPAFYGLVVVHIALIIAFILSFFILPFVVHPISAFVSMVFIWFFTTNKVECKLTNLENSMRKRLGLKRIGGFVGHYFVKPIRLIYARRKLRRA